MARRSLSRTSQIIARWPLSLWLLSLVISDEFCRTKAQDEGTPGTLGPGSDAGFTKAVHEFTSLKDCARNCKAGGEQIEDYVECVPKPHIFNDYPGFDLICRCRMFININRKNCRPDNQPYGNEDDPDNPDEGDNNGFSTDHSGITKTDEDSGGSQNGGCSIALGVVAWVILNP